MYIHIYSEFIYNVCNNNNLERDDEFEKKGKRERERKNASGMNWWWGRVEGMI